MPRLDATVGVLGRFASPCFVLGRQRRSAAQRVRLASLAPSGLVWLATRPSTQAELTQYPTSAGIGRTAWHTGVHARNRRTYGQVRAPRAAPHRPGERRYAP